MKMERARSAVTNFFGRVPLTYTRFSLTPQTDGDASQVEMKLADEEECGDQIMNDHVVKHRGGNGGCKNLCFKILGTVLLFLIGFLLGYLVYRGRAQCPSTLVENNSEDESFTEMYSEPEIDMALDLSSLKSMLNKKVDSLFFERSIDVLSRNSREAGSDDEDFVAKTVRDEFMKMSLDKVWIDEHYVTLQNNGRSNKITVFKADGSVDETFNPSAYVAYSPAGSVVAGIVYSHYGRIEDFDALRVNNIDLVGKLILVRSGFIPFSEKVRNAERVNATGVLIYPDPSDFTFPDADKEIESPFGHAHFGTGDPFTPGFPSFNNTQFPPSKSSGLPAIPVQSLSSKDGKALLGKLDRDGCPGWPYGCKLGQQYKNIMLEVKNSFAEKKIYNVFGVLKGFDEPDRYVVVGAQRDSWGPGVAKAVVGSSVLVELAHVLSEMVKTEGYKPRRSIVFASWSAGDYGSVGATEWLEGYLTTLHLKAISYINLDAIVQGSGSFQVLTSPMLYNLVEKVMKEITDPMTSGKSLYDQFTQSKSNDCMHCFSMDDAAYPFLAFSGIPSISFSFQKDNKPYAYLGTTRDTFEAFKKLVAVDQMCRTAVKFAAQIVLRLTHDHALPFDYTSYKTELFKVTSGLNNHRMALTARGLTLRWVNSAWGDFSRAAASLKESFSNSDLENKPFLRSLNDRVMKVEHSLLSPYVSPKETPFRHVLYGVGDHTVSALMNHLILLKSNESLFNDALFKNQLALLTWTLQGAANALVGEVWEIDNEF